MNDQMVATEEVSKWLIFAKPWQDRIYPDFAKRLAYAAKLKKKELKIASGFRSIDEQVTAGKDALTTNKDYYQKSDGAVYDEKGQCMVSAPGNSSHNWGIAVDVDGWMETMPSVELEKYGLRRPMVYEPWHLEPIETKGLTLEEKKKIFYSYMRGRYYPMDIKSFQMIAGLIPDGIVGPKTIAKAEEMKDIINKMMVGNVEPVQTGEQAIKWLVTNKIIDSPDYWLQRIKEVKYLDSLLIKIANEFRG